MLEHLVEHLKSNESELQLVSEQAPYLLLGEFQIRYFLAYEQGMRYLIFLYTSVVEREQYL